MMPHVKHEQITLRRAPTCDEDDPAQEKFEDESLLEILIIETAHLRNQHLRI